MSCVWSATMVEVDDEMKDYKCTPNESFSEIERRFPGITVEATTSKLCTAWDSVNAAKAWCTAMSTIAYDSAVMYGYESEPLVQQYKFLRMNTGMFHILQYIWGGKLVYDDQGKQWRMNRITLEAGAQLAKWLEQYKLTPFSS